MELASQYGRYGYRRITVLLQREGWRVNHKRVERLRQREGLESASQTTETRSFVAERWFLSALKAGISRTCLELRFYDGANLGTYPEIKLRTISAKAM
jgi:transposase InsO family protein